MSLFYVCDRIRSLTRVSSVFVTGSVHWHESALCLWQDPFIDTSLFCVCDRIRSLTSWFRARGSVIWTRLLHWRHRNTGLRRVTLCQVTSSDWRDTRDLTPCRYWRDFNKFRPLASANADVTNNHVKCDASPTREMWCLTNTWNVMLHNRMKYDASPSSKMWCLTNTWNGIPRQHLKCDASPTREMWFLTNT